MKRQGRKTGGKNRTRSKGKGVSGNDNSGMAVGTKTIKGEEKWNRKQGKGRGKEYKGKRKEKRNAYSQRKE